MEEVVLKVKVEGGGEATNTVKSLKQELRDAKRAAEQAAEGTDEYFAAISRAADAKDKLEDINKAVNALNPGDKAAAFGQLFNTIAGGFQTVTGLYGLFGAKSEEVEKILLQVQSASALAMGIQSITEGIKQWDNLKVVIMSTTVVQRVNSAATVVASGVMKLFGASVDTTSRSFQFLKGAIIATGIGALIVILGEVANAMGAFSSSTDDATEAQKRFREEQERMRQESQDWNNQFSKDLIASGGIIGNRIKLEKRFLQASGETTDGLIKNDIAFQKSVIATAEAVLETADISAKAKRDAETAIYDANNNIKVLETELTTFYKEEAKKRKEIDQKAIDDATEYYLWKVEQEKKSQDLANKELEIQTKYGISQEEINNEWQQSTIDDYGAFLDDLGKRRAEYFNQVQADYLNTVATQDLLDQNRLLDEQLMADFQLTQDNIDLKYQDWQTKHKGSYADFMSWLRGSLQEERDLNIENAESIRQARLQMAQSTLNGLISLGELFINDEKKRVKFQKVATVAQLALDTASAISTTIANATKAASAGGPAAPFLQASYIASGIAQVLASFLAAKKALTDSSLSQIAGGGGGGSTSFSAPSINTPTNQQSFTTPGTDAQGNYKIFVTESDISNTQQLVAGNLKKALLG